MRAIVFPGQGSQQVGMGRELADASAAARAVFQEVDEALGQHLFRLMVDGPAEDLTLTANAQPAIMAHAIAVLRVLEEMAGKPFAALCGATAGHSLGEYTALCAAGAFDLATTARLLRLRGDAMQSAVPVGEGAMAVLLGADIAAAEALAADVADGETCTVANDNDPSQVVISGHAGAIGRAIAAARERGIKRAMPLPVSAPFHCPLMAPAAEAMDRALADHPPLPPTVTLFANVTAAPLADAGAIRPLLVEQVTARVRWRESAQAMAQAGVGQFIELGGKVLAPMIKRSVGDTDTVCAVTMADLETLAKGL